MWQAIRKALPFRLGWTPAPVFDPFPQNMAYASFGQIPVTISPNSGGTIFMGTPDVVTPGMYRDTHTVLVGQAPMFDGMTNQALGYPGEVSS
jgi:hypothetical protein